MHTCTHQPYAYTPIIHTCVHIYTHTYILTVVLISDSLKSSKFLDLAVCYGTCLLNQE